MSRGAPIESLGQKGVGHLRGMARTFPSLARTAASCRSIPSPSHRASHCQLCQFGISHHRKNLLEPVTDKSSTSHLLCVHLDTQRPASVSQRHVFRLNRGRYSAGGCELLRFFRASGGVYGMWSLRGSIRVCRSERSRRSTSSGWLSLPPPADFLHGGYKLRVELGALAVAHEVGRSLGIHGALGMASRAIVDQASVHDLGLDGAAAGAQRGAF